jgi:hypothetical protein
MPEYRVAFEVGKANTIDLPADLPNDGRYRVDCGSDGAANAFGNENGLLYLADPLVRCALGGYQAGVHVHLPLDSSVGGPNVDLRPELTTHAPAARL